MTTLFPLTGGNGREGAFSGLQYKERLRASIPIGFEPAVDGMKKTPLLIASTLMVPGHIDAQEIGSIARLVTSLNPELPYSLPAFHPDDKMADLLITSRKETQECLEAASEAGLSSGRKDFSIHGRKKVVPYFHISY
jgi:hypothetical protein